MANWEIAFRINYDYPFVKMSEKYRDTRISMWCVWNREMVHVPLDHEDAIMEVEEFIGSVDRRIDEYKPASDGFVLTLKCTCDLFPNVYDIISENKGIDIPPSVFLNGEGYYRAIMFSEENIKSLFKALSKIGRVELLSKRAIHSDIIPSTVWTESFFTGLTDRQMEAVQKAFDFGYYSSPRKVTTDSIASSLGISRSTYEEHLRKAENRIMEAIVPYMKLFKAGSRKQEEVISPSIAVVDTGAK